MTLEIVLVPLLKDNYGYLLREPAAKLTAVVDPSEAEPVLAMARGRGWELTHVLNTHHHHDHTGGNLRLKQATGCKIVGPKADHDRIPGIDIAVEEGQRFEFGTTHAEILFIPGHTRGHIAYWFPESAALFCGDTLFAMGCGRMFEGTAPQMWASLGKLRALPAATRVYCGHEYTQNNARFALTVEPGNAALKQRALQVDELRSRGAATIPSTIGEERATNPFMRCSAPDVVAHAAPRLGAERSPVAVLAAIRAEKDDFRG
jgi:hydroxyacylglutathione hydrolase